MSIYDTALPQAGFICLVAHIDDVKVIVGLLIEGDEYCINGSSFAITTDTSFDYRKVWLSQASYKRLKKDARFTLPSVPKVRVEDFEEGG